MSEELLEVEKLSKEYVYKSGLFTPKTAVQAAREVCFTLNQGESLGLVGESGSGKSTVARLILRLMEPNAGTITFQGKRLTDFSEKAMRRIRKDLQIIFQAGSTALDPRRSIQEHLAEPLRIHRIVDESEISDEIDRLLDRVGISSQERGKTAEHMSGGQVQRILIARALALRPSLIVCDEPVSALDVSVQGQILNLLMDLKESFGLSYLFITHDLKVARRICNRIAVMRHGRIVEIGATEDILDRPEHSYTQMLVESML